MAKKNSKLPIISDTLERALLEDIELKGLPFEQISLVKLCDDKELIYGSPSSDLRRALQKHFCKLKKRSLKNYLKLLKKYTITPGPFTFHRIREAGDCTPTKTSIKDPTTDEEESNKDIIEELEAAEELLIADSTSIESASIESASESSINLEDDIASKFENFCSIGLRSPPLLHKMMTTPTRTPNRKKVPSIASYLASPLRAPIIEDTDSLTEEEQEDAAYTLLDFRDQLGTKDQPFIVMANPNYPERNGPIFNICRLEDVEHSDHEHQGFHIRLSVDLPDYSAWEAFIPNPNMYPSLLPLYGRIIMFKGPSRPFWLQSFERYHEDKRKIDCKVTRKVHEKMDTAIEGDPERHHQYHLVVFKPGTSLDNSIFSDNNTNVARNENSMKMESKDLDNGFDKKIYGMGLWWRVAEAGGTRIRNTNKKVNAKHLLD
jgi:hypothetical protein